MAATKELGLTPEGIAILEQDFGAFTSRAIAANKAFYRGFSGEEFGEPKPGSELVYGRRAYRFDESGVVWFKGQKDKYDGEPYGRPADYLQIRDNYDSLKIFIAQKLDDGRIDTSTSGHGGSPDETNPAEYISFMCTASESGSFKGNVRRAVIELLGAELDRQFEPLDYQSARKEVEDFENKLYKGREQDRFAHLSREDLRGAFWRLGLDYPADERGIKMKQRVEEELGRTERPMTLDEYMVIYGGTDEQKRTGYEESVKTGRLRGVVHIEETSEEFRQDLSEFLIDVKAQRKAAEKFGPQFNRLVGLLELVRASRTAVADFGSLYPALLQKAQERFYFDEPDLPMGIRSINLYNQVLLALLSVQSGDALRDFWLQNISLDPNSQRVITSVLGVMAMRSQSDGRKSEIPGIVAAIQGRASSIDIVQPTRTMPWFFFEETIRTRVFDLVAETCYGGKIFHHYNQDTGTLDFLRSAEDFSVGKYTYEFDRYSAIRESAAAVIYDVATDTFEGDQTYLDSVKHCIDETGLELPGDVAVTSLVGRKIGKADETRIVDLVYSDGTDLYEGVIELNHVPLPFLYNASQRSIRIGVKSLRESSRFFAGRDSWNRSKFKPEDIKEKVSEADLATLEHAGPMIDAYAQEVRDNRTIRAAIFDLEGKVNAELEPHIVNILHSHLVTNAQDLIS